MVKVPFISHHALAFFAAIVLASSGPSVAIAQDAAADREPVTVESYQGLKELLKRDNIAFEAVDEAKYVACPTEKDGLDSVLVIRWDPTNGVVHFVQIMPIEVPEANQVSFMEAIVRMNHAYPVPGLGYNHDTKTTYFRMTVPLLPRGHLVDSEIQEYFSYSVNQAAILLPTMNAVAAGEIAAKQALEFHNNRLSVTGMPAGRYEREIAGMTWTLVLKEDGTTTLLRDGKRAVSSKVVINGDRLTFEDGAGPLASDTPGIYTFDLYDDGIVFEKVDDESTGRAKILAGDAWKIVK